jgi:hypothetical protein
MSLFRKSRIFVPLLFLGIAGCASHMRRHTITTVPVAGYEYGHDNAEDNIAISLTIGVLRKHGIDAGGAGEAGSETVSVPTNQAERAHRILENELAGLSQKQRDSFVIEWNWERGNLNAPDFLTDLPQLKKFKANTSETEFLGMLRRQKIDCTKRAWPDGTILQYELRPKADVTVYITFKQKRSMFESRTSRWRESGLTVPTSTWLLQRRSLCLTEVWKLLRYFALAII